MRQVIFTCFACCICFFSCKKEFKTINAAGSENQLKSTTARSSAILPNPYKAPLYWNPYEYNIINDGYIPEAEWLSNITWMEQNLKQYGYKMICIDGWGDDGQYNADGYRTTHSSNWDPNHTYSYWSTYLQARGMTLGIYNNPLWIIQTAANNNVKIKGTNILLSTLIDQEEITNNYLFRWVRVDRPGAEEYVKGYIQYYADMGVKYLRVDFLSWFEDGMDKGNRVGVGHTHADYVTALRWMREACDANGMFLSLVMPHLFNDAAEELQYGHMIRVNEDAGFDSDWNRFSDLARGVDHPWWSKWYSAFDGYQYWSRVSGRGGMILDGDFIRLNKLANDDERKSVISLNLIAGGPVSVSDRHSSIGSNLWLYQNTEMLALNTDGFVGKPLNNNPADMWNVNGQIWKGQMSNGDWVVGLFNREGSALSRSINFATELGLVGNASVRDLWAHQDLGAMSSYAVTVPAHGVVVIKVVGATNSTVPAPWIRNDIGTVNPAGSASYTSGTFTNYGAGADIEGTADAFSFINQRVAGDVTITAKVNSIANTNPYAKSGVMIRESLNANSIHAFTTITPSNGVLFQRRTTTGGGTTTTASAGFAAPYWVRVKRVGNSITSFRSLDNITWVQVGVATTVTMTSDVYVGLASTSHADGTLGAGVFSNVSITTIPSPWINTNIGSVNPLGSSSYTGGIYTINGAGADIEGIADAFNYTYRTFSGNVTVTAKVNTLSNTNAFAKTGVMIRESLNADSKNAFVAITPTSGINFQRRITTGGGTTGTLVSGFTAPYWVRVKRVGTTFTAFRSTNGTTWVQIGGNVTISMPASIFIGLPITSHVDGTLATATISNVTVL